MRYITSYRPIKRLNEITLYGQLAINLYHLKPTLVLGFHNYYTCYH